MTKWQKLGIAGLVLFNALVLKIIWTKMLPADTAMADRELPTFTIDQLAKYNGNDADMPIYLGMNGYVYDVSPGRADFYGPGQAYNYIVGKDSSTELNLVGGDLIKRKYKIVGKLNQ